MLTSPGNVKRHTENGVTLTFPFDFKLDAASHLVVESVDLNGAITTLSYPADYSVTGLRDNDGGSITKTAAAPDGYGLVLRREVPLDQLAKLRGQTALDPVVLEDALDKLTEIAQQHDEELSRTFRSSSAVGGINAELPPSAPGYALGWNATGDALVNVPNTGADQDADLASTTDAAKGAGKVGFLSSLAYAAGTVGAFLKSLVSSAGSSFVGFIQAGTGAVARTMQAKARDTISLTDYGVISDGVTDQTAEIIAKLAALETDGFRGWIKLPYNTKFNVATVYAAVPTGIILDDESSINWAQPPEYKNKFRVMYSGDLVDDDTAEVVGSGHHPALMLLNMGTSGSASGNARYASILHGVGKDSTGDPLLGWLYQYAKSPSTNKWRQSLRLQTPYLVAIGNPSAWTTGQVVAANSYRLSDGGKVYKTTLGGTCGATAPTGTGAAINDGAVLWDYVQAAINIDSTRYDIDEDGVSGQYGPATVPVTHTMQSGSRSFYFGVDGTSNDVFYYDASRAADVWRASDTKGIQFGQARSPNRLAVTGATFNAPATGDGRITQTGATNVTTMNRPVGRTRMSVTLRFDDGNSTMKHGTGTDAFRLKGAADVTPAAGTFMSFELDTTDSGSWREVSRSF